MSNRINLADILPHPTTLANSLPVTSRLQRLPLAELSWENFERLCVRLVNKDSDAEFAQAYGVRGQNQEGIDLYVRKRSNERYIVWQCKRYQAFQKSDVTKAVCRFIKAFKTKEAGIPIKEANVLVLAVTADLSNTTIAKEIERQNKRLKRWFNIALIPCDIQGLSDKLKPYSDIVADFFGPIWVEEFCGIKQSSVLASEMESAVIQTTLRTVQEGLSSYGNADLDRIRDLWGERHEDDALVELEKFKTTATWPLLSVEVRAKALRIEAGLRLQKGHTTTAKTLFDEARKTAPNANARVLEGRLIYHDRGADAALAFLSLPTTDDERVFRWNLLLELGRPKEVTDEFSALEKQEVPAGDFAAILALAQLAQYDVSAADQTIRITLQKKPRHVTSRYVAAVVDYYWGISPAFRAWQHMTWPVPPPWNLVKRDKNSHDRRLNAARTFEELAATVLKTSADELRAWQLACVALNSNDANEPSKLAQLYLADNPANQPVLVWASALGLEFDRSNSLTALRQRLDAASGSLEDLLVLLGLLDDVSNFTLYEELLARHRPLFGEADREHLWFLHQAQVLVERDKTADALKLVESMPEGEESRHIRMAVRNLIVERTRRKEDYQLLLKAQEEDYQVNKTPENLLACCRTSRLLQQWDFIATHAGELVQGVGTQSALELAAEGLLQVRRPKDCLDLLEKNRAFCPEGEWTPFLRQIAAEAHRLLGNLPAAILELERAAASETGVAAKMQLFRALLLKGDLSSALQIARSFSSSPHVPAEFIVGQVIPIARHHDLELAKELIVKMESAATELSPQAEAKLMDEAYRAGVESVSNKLTSKLTQQAIKGEGPLKAFSYEQTRQMLIDRQKMAGELLKGYACGEIPAHLVSSGLNLPLAKLLHETPRLNIKSQRPVQSQAVFTRYASDANSQPCALPPGLKELFLDVSSILLLDALGLLSRVETAFDRLHVGSSLIQCLEEHLDQLSPQQPPRSTARLEVIGLLDASKLTIWQSSKPPLPSESPLASFTSDLGAEWCQRLSQVHSESGLFVDFLPLHARSDIHRAVLLPDSFAEIVISAPLLISAMKRVGWISGSGMSEESSAAKSNLPNEDRIRLREGMTIHLDTGQAEELAVAGVLSALSEKLCVTIEAGEAVRLRNEVAKERADEELKQEIRRLLAHISGAIGKSKYQVHAEWTSEREEESSLQATERALYEAIDFGERHNIPVCIDDRAVRRHSMVGKSPLCDTWDLLHYLHTSGAITVAVFQDVRSKMRLANLRYLPLSTEEILSCIQAAPIQDGQLKETPELVCLRRYVFSTLLDHATLQNPLRDHEGKVHPREGTWPARLQVTIAKTLADVWLSAVPTNSHAELQADWIWFNLCFDERLLAETFGQKLPDYQPLDAVARQIATMFALGVGLYESANKSTSIVSRRKRYFQWLTDRVVFPLQSNNSDVWSRIGERLRTMFSFLTVDVQKLRARKGKTNIDERVIQHLIASYIADLPAELTDGLKFNPAELDELGLTSNSPGIETLGLAFPAKDFWEAIARALKQGHATLRTPDHKTKLRIRFNGTTNQISVSAKGATNSAWRVLRVPCVGLLSADPKRRELALRRELSAFDLDEPRLSEVIHEIGDISSPPDRVAKRLAYREQSATTLYTELHEDVREKKTIAISDLLPAQIDCLRRYLRLELTDKTLDGCAQRLLEKLGWTEAVIRLSRLPVNLPDFVINEWKQLSADEQGSRLKELEAQLYTPIERIQLLELLCHPATTAPERLPKTKAQLDWLSDEAGGVAHGRALLTVVRWVHLRLGWHVEASKWPPFARLCVAWSHGCAMYRAFQTAKAGPASVEKWFSANSQELFADRFTLTNGLAHEAANPADLKASTLILRGIASACSSLTDDQILELESHQKLPSLFEDRPFADLLDLWADRSLGSNLLASYLADGADEKLRRVVGDTAFAERFQVQPRSIAEQALGTLANNPGDLNSMFLLNCVIGDRPIYENLRTAVSQLLDKIDMVQLFDSSPGECTQYILFSSQLAASSKATNLMDKVWEESRRVAEHLAASDSTNGKVSAAHEQLALSFTDAAIRLSPSQDGQKAGLQIFIKRLTDLARSWPAFAKYHGPALIQALSRVPTNDLAGFPQLMALLRAHT